MGKSYGHGRSAQFPGGPVVLGMARSLFAADVPHHWRPKFYQRINAAKDLKTARAGLIGCLAASLVVMPLIACISFIGRLYFGSNIAAGQSLIATASLLPVFWGGLLLSAASAFIITTADSFLLSASSNFTVDIYTKVINPHASEREQMWATRLFIAGAGVLAYVILQFYPSILAVQYMSYTISGCAITPAVVSVLVWPKVTKFGGIARWYAVLLRQLFGKYSSIPTEYRQSMLRSPYR